MWGASGFFPVNQYHLQPVFFWNETCDENLMLLTCAHGRSATCVGRPHGISESTINRFRTSFSGEKKCAICPASFRNRFRRSLDHPVNFKHHLVSQSFFWTDLPLLPVLRLGQWRKTQRRNNVWQVRVENLKKTRTPGHVFSGIDLDDSEVDCSVLYNCLNWFMGVFEQSTCGRSHIFLCREVVNKVCHIWTETQTKIVSIYIWYKNDKIYNIKVYIHLWFVLARSHGFLHWTRAWISISPCWTLMLCFGGCTVSGCLRSHISPLRQRIHILFEHLLDVGTVIMS
jgi:hypothetical protein